MINAENFFRNIDTIHDQMKNPDNFRNRVAILDEHKNLVFVDANDPRVKDFSVNQLDYITSRFKELAAPFKQRRYSDRPIIVVRPSERESLIKKLNLIYQTSLELARLQQSYSKAAGHYFLSFANPKFDPILKAKTDMEKAINRIDKGIVGDPKLELKDKFTAVIADLRHAAATASESIAETVKGYRDKDKTVTAAESCLTNVNQALTKLRSAISKSGRDVEDILKKCSSQEGKLLLNDPSLKGELRATLNELYDTFASIAESLLPPTKILNHVMSRLYFRPDTESGSNTRVNASAEEKTYASKLGELNSLMGYINKIKGQRGALPATLLLNLNQMRTLIEDLSQLEKTYPSLIRQKINNMIDRINELKNSIQMEQKRDPVNEKRIEKIKVEINECDTVMEERMAALQGLRALIKGPIVGNAKEVVKELDESPILATFPPANKYERPLTIDLDFWLFDGLKIGSFSELMNLDNALHDHDRAMDGMSTSRTNPLKALRELDEAVFGVAKLPPLPETKKKR